VGVLRLTCTRRRLCGDRDSPVRGCVMTETHLYKAEAVWRQRVTCTRLCDDRDSPVRGGRCVETEAHLYEAEAV